MSQATEWSPGGPETLCADSIADRMLQALERDYLDTLQAGSKQSNNSPEEALKLPQGQSSVDYTRIGVSNEDAGASSAFATASASESIGADHPVQDTGKKEQQAELLLKKPCESREGEDSDSSSEHHAEFGYERLPSSEELPSPHSLSDEDAKSAQSFNTRKCRSRSTGSLECLPESSGHQGVDASGAAAGAQQAATRPPAESPRESESHGPPEEEPALRGEEQHQLTPPEKVEDSHREAFMDGEAPVAEQRPVLRGDMPLDEHSAAFITETMRGLSLQDPRRDVRAEPTA